MRGGFSLTRNQREKWSLRSLHSPAASLRDFRACISSEIRVPAAYRFAGVVGGGKLHDCRCECSLQADAQQQRCSCVVDISPIYHRPSPSGIKHLSGVNSVAFLYSSPLGHVLHDLCCAIEFRAELCKKTHSKNRRYIFISYPRFAVCAV